MALAGGLVRMVTGGVSALPYGDDVGVTELPPAVARLEASLRRLNLAAARCPSCPVSTTPARDLFHCVTGSLGGCGNVLLDAVGIRPAMQIAQGIAGTGYTIYHDFATGHTGRALGTLTTFAALILATRGAGAEADATAAAGEPTAALGDTSSLLPGYKTFAAAK